MDWTWFWTWFGRIDNVAGLITVVVTTSTYFYVRRQNRLLVKQAQSFPRAENFAEMVENYRGIKSAKPVAFSLSLIPDSDSISKSVQVFLDSKKWKMPIVEFNMNGIHDTADLDTLVHGLIEKKRHFEVEGFTEVHLFIAGPVQAGTIVGSIFDSWLPVKLYHKPTPTPPQVYEYWMPLALPVFRAAPEKI